MDGGDAANSGGLLPCPLLPRDGRPLCGVREPAEPFAQWICGAAVPLQAALGLERRSIAPQRTRARMRSMVRAERMTPTITPACRRPTAYRGRAAPAAGASSGGALREAFPPDSPRSR